MKLFKYSVVLWLGVSLVAPAVVLGQAPSSASYRLLGSSFNSASGKATSASYSLRLCLGTESEISGKLTSSSYVLHAGCTFAVPAGLPADDDDGDMIPNSEESSGPNGGDGNDDGELDATQGNVGTTTGTQGPLTIEACEDAACTLPCQLTGVRTLSESELPEESPDIDFPFGLLEFVAHCSPVFIKVYYHSSNGITSPPFVYEKYGPNPPGVPPSEFYELPGVTFGVEAVGSDPQVATASFMLVDGVLGDDTGVDGLIVDQGGPGRPTIPTPAPAIGRSGLIAGFFALLSVAALAMVRRRKSSV